MSKKLPYAPKAMFFPDLDMAGKLSYGQKSLTIHCDETATAKPKYTNPRKQTAKCIKRKCRWTPSRNQRKAIRLEADIIENERTWLRGGKPKHKASRHTSI